MLGLVEARKHKPAAVLLRPEALDCRPEGAPEDVVGQHDHDPRAAGEALGLPERVGDPGRALLVGERESLDPVLVPVAQQPQELTRVRPAGDDHQLLDPHRDERLDGVGNHRPVVDRQQVLVRDLGQRVQARARPARQDDALHRG